MFDPKKLEHFLDGLQVETHFPEMVPQKVIELPRTVLDAKMDRYDIFKQAEEDYENVSTEEFPVLAHKSLSPFNFPMYAQWQGWATYGQISRACPSTAYWSGYRLSDTADTSYPGPPPPLQETPYSRLKSKISRVAESGLEKVADPTPSSPSSSPDLVCTIKSWRAWEVTNGMLVSIGSDSVWEPGQAAKSYCRAGCDHSAPSLNCDCGYWSFKTRELLIQAIEGYACQVDVIGEVEIWGRVVECENGFRSEYAYPKELWLLEEGLESLSWKYGVGVRKLG